MFRIVSSFYYLIFVLMAGSLLVRVIYYFKLERDTQLSEFDKSLWHLKFISACFAVLMYVSLCYLPSGFYELIDLKTSSPDVVLGQLVRNQEKIGQDIRQASQICYFLAFMTASYLAGVATFIGKSQNEKRKTAAKQDPMLKKPLGL